MAGIIAGPPTRPNRITSVKDSEYHDKYARWVVDRANHVLHSQFISKTLINWNFYKGNQWIFQEDLSSFLMDESGEPRNRIRFVENLVRPIVEQYVGNAVRMDVTAEAKSISEFAINRREMELERMKFYSETAMEGGLLGDIIQSQVPVAKDEGEVEQIFNNIWVDDVEITINNLIRYISSSNDFEELKVRLAKQLAISGMPILKNFVRNGEQVFDITDPLFFIFDRNAKRPDLKDAEFMGEYAYMAPPEIFERFQNISLAERKAIETYSSNQNNSYFNSFYMHNLVTGFEGRIPVYEVYWKDIEVREYGYVIDEFGYEMFTVVNDKEVSEYTTSDLVNPQDEGAYKGILRGKKSRKLYIDVLRYCIFIPREAIGSEKINEDILLDWGVVPYQETSLTNPSGVDYPYKTYCWGYHNGEVLSPVDDIIQPQRFVNRLLSVMESQVNNSRGSGTVLDKDMIDPQDGEEGILRSMNTSKPVFVNAKGNLNNSIGSYDSTIGSGTMNLINIADQMRASLQRITGVNEQMQGTTGGQRELVGVTQLAIQRGTLIQEPVYFALSKVLLQSYNAMVTQGKRLYADNKRKLSIMVGDQGAQDIILTDDMKIEDFRVFIKRTTSEDEQKLAANELLLQLMTAGIIDSATFSSNFNRVDLDGVARALRDLEKQKQEVQRIEGQRQGQMAQQQAAAMEGEAQAAEASQIMANDEGMVQQQMQQDFELEQIAAKGDAARMVKESGEKTGNR